MFSPHVRLRRSSRQTGAPLIRISTTIAILKGVAFVVCIGAAIFAAIITAMFIVLKLKALAVINFGWIWITAPLWPLWMVVGFPIAFTIIALVVMLMLNSIIFVVYHVTKLLRRK